MAIGPESGRELRALLGRFQTYLPAFAERVRLIRPAARTRRKQLSAKTRAEVFRDIFSSNGWRDCESASGGGSTLAATEQLRDVLSEVIKRYQIMTLVDIPCGDFNWMRHVDLDSVTYIGIDIVPELVQKLQDEFGNPTRRFEVGDVVTSELPPADAVICRDLFLHLSLSEARTALRRLRDNYRVVLVSSNPSIRRNLDIVTGESRQLNLELEPFNLQPPDAVISDGTERFPRRVIGVWVR